MLYGLSVNQLAHQKNSGPKWPPRRLPNSKPQDPAKPVIDRRFQIFIESKIFSRIENFKIKNSQDLPEKMDRTQIKDQT